MAASSPQILPPDEYVARLAKKRMAAGVLFRNEQDQVLLLRTHYKPHLEIPGGAVETGEAPWTTATRELVEELSWDRPLGRLLVLDHVLPHDDWPEGMLYLFDGGLINQTDRDSMVFRDGEVLAADFWDLNEARAQMKSLVADRVAAGLEALAEGVTVWCEHGRRVA
ncbi:NUDIX domain-containing protein [Saccharothrix hoggarensis]|uniref:NUDIX domain-containing protein n=1 Tax=Saccharothrix hoggarensis TaxID=913853 RepID=A0ABW3QHK4_9PSEU